ncbi:MAG: D-lyxose/D-mannose family sugar isomerase [Candidatus Lokiarchaeota archaeon]|nr:D-lyxose/D-mannose family sugar isomerase [Candidatus Lokiarchaeota archaeon]
MNASEASKWVQKAREMLRDARIVVTEAELSMMEVADFNLPAGNFPAIGLEIIVYENNDRYCAKELVLFPGQSCPEHKHPAVAGKPGKQETFRCRWGEVYLYVPGDPTPNRKAVLPENKRSTFTVGHEIVLKPGDQYTLPPDTWHWFQGGPKGAIVSEFSSTSTDENDVFTDKEIKHDKSERS